MYTSDRLFRSWVTSAIVKGSSYRVPHRTPGLTEDVCGGKYTKFFSGVLSPFWVPSCLEYPGHYCSVSTTTDYAARLVKWWVTG